jgi:hypothetical protein
MKTFINEIEHERNTAAHVILFAERQRGCRGVSRVRALLGRAPPALLPSLAAGYGWL